MIKPKEHFHGSDLEKIEQIYGIKKEEITSFSANVNPLGVSFQLKDTLAAHIDAITSYPDREYASLRGSISNYITADSSNILVGNGSTELISLFIQYLCPQKALILSPTYSEYEREISLGNGVFSYYPLNEKSNFQLNIEEFIITLTDDLDLVILCNPNNPTSSSISSADMERILITCRRNNTFVLVDETYVEFAEIAEEITAVPLTKIYDNLIVLRGISKFFAAPGLRLGYAVCGNKALLDAVNEKKNPWTINTLAAIAGEIMFQDEEYIKKTKELIFAERSRICKMLRDCPQYKIYEPTANFILVRIVKEGLYAKDVFESAIKKGLMIRDCSTFPYLDDSYFRFCFMSPEKNDELLSVLKEL